jgi:hypothetical protein
MLAARQYVGCPPVSDREGILAIDALRQFEILMLDIDFSPGQRLRLKCSF